MNAFHLLGAIYLLACALVGVVLGKAFGANLVGAALAGALGGAVVGALARRGVLALVPSRPGCNEVGCKRKDFDLVAVRLETHARTVEGESARLLEDGFLYRCKCGRLYFKTPRRLGRHTRLLVESDDGVLRSYMRASPILGIWERDPEPDPPRSPYRS